MNPLELVLKRRFPHPPAFVYEMWSSAEHLAEWLRPYDEIVLTIDLFQFVEGGEYRFRYTWPDGLFPLQGTFLTIRPGESLIFTWEPQPPDVDAGKQTLVSVWFRAIGTNETEIELRHTLFPDETMHRRHEEGWCVTFERFSSYLNIRSQT